MGVEFGNSSESTTSPTVGTECRPPGLKGDDVIYYVYKYTFVGILTVICLMGNALVIATLPRSRKFSRPSVYFIVSLACSDFMSGIIFPIYVVSHIEVEAIQNTLGKLHYDFMIRKNYLSPSHFDHYMYLNLQK